MRAHARTPHARRRAPRQAGFSLIELLVSVGLFSIVIGAIYGLLVVGRSDSLHSRMKIEVIQNLRIGMNAIGRDATNAGIGFDRGGALIPDNTLALFGFTEGATGVAHADADNDPDSLTPIVPFDDFNPSDINPWAGTMTDQVTFVFQDDQFAQGQPVTILNINGGQQLRFDTKGPDGLAGTGDDFNAEVECAIGDLYIVCGSTASALAVCTSIPGPDKIDLANSDPLALNQPGNGPVSKVDEPASLYKISWVTYYVTRSGSLIRRVYGNPQNLIGSGAVTTETRWLDEPLAQGVENLQMRYILDDGGVTTNPTPAQRPQIRQIEVTMTVRSPENEARTNRPFRTTMTSSFSTRNLGYGTQLGAPGT